MEVRAALGSERIVLQRLLTGMVGVDADAALAMPFPPGQQDGAVAWDERGPPTPDSGFVRLARIHVDIAAGDCERHQPD
jgi:hypothetical protein